MTTIRIRPIGQDGPIITGEVVSEDDWGWDIRLAPNTRSVFFPKREWELVPVPFVFPTAFGARITGVNSYGDQRQFIFDNEGKWRANSGVWSEDEITEQFTDLRVVEADPDWGDE